MHGKRNRGKRKTRPSKPGKQIAERCEGVHPRLGMPMLREVKKYLDQARKWINIHNDQESAENTKEYVERIEHALGIVPSPED